MEPLFCKNESNYKELCMSMATISLIDAFLLLSLKTKIRKYGIDNVIESVHCRNDNKLIWNRRCLFCRSGRRNQDTLHGVRVDERQEPVDNLLTKNRTISMK